MHWSVLVVVTVSFFQVANSKLSSTNQVGYADVRCKCICPQEQGSNRTRNVFVATVEPDQCKCEHIVKREESFCLRCQCMYEARNTILIKVVIIFIVVLLVCMIIYALYLFVDSKISPFEISVTSDEMQEQLAARSHRRRRFSVRGIDQRHSRWKQEVAAQRRHIYDTRTMLS